MSNENYPGNESFTISLTLIEDCYLGRWMLNELSIHMQKITCSLLGRHQANLCFHFAGSGENLPDITKSRDASLDNDLLALSSRS